MQNRWIRFVKGFLVIRVDGDYMERFFNMCRMHEIDLWEIKKEQDVCMCEAYAADFLRMPPLLRKAQRYMSFKRKDCRFTFLLSKKGLFFLRASCCV